MHVILSAILLALAILDLVIGTGFLIDPGSSGADFGLTIASTHGESDPARRHDGVFLRDGDLAGTRRLEAARRLAVPGARPLRHRLYRRFINVIAQGPYDGWMVPMAVEAFHCIVIIVAMRAWGWPKASS